MFKISIIILIQDTFVIENIKSFKEMVEQLVKPILYNYWRSGSSWRVRCVLHWKGIDYEYRVVDTSKSQQNQEEYHKLNPFERIPTLLVDGLTLAESVAICEYLDETRKEKPLLPTEPGKRAIVRQLCEILNSGV